MPPEETAARMKPFFDALGITRVANVTGLDVLGIPTFMVARPNGRSLSVHQGKGADVASARASGIMEAAEHHLAEHATDPSNRRRLALAAATFDEIRRQGRVVDVARLPGSVRPFDAGTKTLWTHGRDLATGEPVWVPFEMVHVDLRLPVPPGSGYFPLGSNGLASGNEPREAILHGLAELVERDAMTLFYGESAERQAARRIDPATVDAPAARALLDRFHAADIEVALWDATSDVAVPVVFCMAVDRAFDPFRPVGVARGSGAHPSRAVATARALCEAAQSRLTRIVGARDDLQAGDVSRQRAPEATERVLRDLRASPPRVSFASVPSPSDGTLDGDLAALREKLAERDVRELVAVDLSWEELPCSVVRAIAPGLEGVLANPSYRPGARALALALAARREAAP